MSVARKILLLFNKSFSSPLPPGSQERITEGGTVRITEDGQERITE